MPYAKRDSVSIFYESFGEGLPIVFLHPISTNRYVWAQQVFAFARNHRVLVVDHRGHGRSDRPLDGYGIGAMAADLRAVLDDARVDGAVLVGNSAGGMIAVQTALDAPERVLGMMIVSAATNLAPHVPPAVLTAYAERFEAAWGFMLQGSTAARTKRERPEVSEFLEGIHRASDNFSADVFVACMRDRDGVFNWNVESQLEAIRTPTLVIAGQEDQVMPLSAARRLAEMIPGAEFKIVPDVAHFYELERPADFNADLRAFLGRVGT